MTDDPREKREAIAAEIAIREHADLIAARVRDRLSRFFDLELFSTQKDDHTRSLSERVTHIENELGAMRWEWKQHQQHIEWERNMSTWMLIRRRILQVRWRWR